MMHLILAGSFALAGTAYGANTAAKSDMPKPDSAKPQTAKTDAAPDKNALKAAQTAIQNAVIALQKELQAHQKDPKIALREKSNYFTENPSTDLLPEVLLQAIAGTFSSDSIADSYIKWQLLSGISGKFSDALGPQAAGVYMKAPKIPARPGLSANDKRQLDPLTKDVKTADDSVVLTKKLADLVTPWEESIKPIIGYRNELYAKLPHIAGAMVGRLEDIKTRVEAGIDSEVEMKSAIGDLTSWIAGDPPAAEQYAVIEHFKLVAKGSGKQANTGGGKGMGKYGNYGNYPNATMQQFPPHYYDHVAYDTEKEKRWKWVDQATKLSRGETLNDFLVTLEDSAKNSKNTGMQKEMTKK
jgi:hypothetical protein